MPTSTTNYELIKPGTDDPILIEQLNTNADIIDNALKENADALGGKVDKETGKGLSTNDYTTAEKEKLAGIAEGAEVNEIQGIKVNSSTVNPDANKVVNITIPTSAADVSALPNTTKYAAALSLTINSSTFVMTGQLKDQNGDNLGTAQTIDLPLESVVVGGSYNSQTKKVVLTLQNGNTIEFSVADLVSGLQTKLSASNKLNPAYINYDSTHRAVSDTEKSTWNSKQDALSAAQLAAVNSGINSTKVEQIETNKNNILSLTDNAAITSIISDVTTANGFTLEAQSFLYKQGKHIFGRLIISSTNAYTTSDVEPCTISTYKPSPHYVAFCGLGADMWKIKSIGYAYISSSSGTFKVNDSGNNSNYTANIPIDYTTA